MVAVSFIFDGHQEVICKPVLTSQSASWFLERVEAAKVPYDVHALKTGYLPKRNIPPDSVVRVIDASWLTPTPHILHQNPPPMCFPQQLPMIGFPPPLNPNMFVPMPTNLYGAAALAAYQSANCAAVLSPNSLKDETRFNAAAFVPVHSESADEATVSNGAEEHVSSGGATVGNVVEPQLSQKWIVPSINEHPGLDVIIPHELFVALLKGYKCFGKPMFGLHPACLELRWGDLTAAVARYISHGPFYLFCGITFGFFEDV